MGRDWGHEQGSAIQPCIYTHSSTAELELPESSSIRALAGQPVLSDLFVPFRQPAQVSFLLATGVTVKGPGGRGRRGGRIVTGGGQCTRRDSVTHMTASHTFWHMATSAVLCS